MAVVEGVVGRVASRQFNGKNFYSFALNGQDGWYGTGMKKPPAEGTSVRFESKTGSKGYLEVDGAIEVRTDGEPSTARIQTERSSQAGTNTKSGGSGNGASGAYWDRKEARDVHNDELREIGASRNTALNIIDLMVKHEAIKLPAAAKREEFIWTLLDRYTDKLRGKSSNTKEPQETKPERLVTVVEVAPTDDPESDNWS